MKRNYGIDCLRLILMFMVVVLHVIGHGGLLTSAAPLTSQYIVIWLMESLAFCAVNCYALISGYVYFGRKYRISSAALLYLQVLLYSLGIAIFCWILKPEQFTFRNLTYFLFPVSQGTYWYVSAYMGLFILIPLLNTGIQALSHKNTKIVLALTFVMFSILPTLFDTDAFGINGGYSTVWLVFLYMIGAYIRKYDVGQNMTSRKALLAYACCVLLSWGLKIGCEYISARNFVDAGERIDLISYTSPTMVCAAVFLFLCFRNKPVSAKYQRAISVFSPAAFGVYLLSDHRYVREFVISGNFSFLSSCSVTVMAAGVLLSAAFIFMVCVFINLARTAVFRKLHIKEKLIRLEQRLRG